eukprot:606815-Pyramimonas_sp.AAC.1
MAWLGNEWADFFATVALHVVTLSPNFGKGLELRLAEAVNRARFGLGWQASAELRTVGWPQGRA